jgi:hypothetical protein
MVLSFPVRRRPAAPLSWKSHLRADSRHRCADEVHVAFGQAVGLLAVPDRREVCRIELREAEKLQDAVHGCEPVPRETFVDDLEGLDSRLSETAALPELDTVCEPSAPRRPRRASL